MIRQYRDRDFIQSVEGFFFCVVGSCHPKDRVISYLKYVPDKLGIWGNTKKFKRVMQAYTIPNLLKTFEILEKDYPHYVFFSPHYNIKMAAVPHEKIVKHYKPEERLAEITRALHKDSLQGKLTRFLSFLVKISKVPYDFFGVTGSILLDIHRQEFSDMDITVYGLKNSLSLKNALTKAYTTPGSSVGRFNKRSIQVWCESKARKFPMTLGEALRIFEKKWNIGKFENTPFSIHPVKLEEEIDERYGDKLYYPLAPVVIRAVVVDDTNSMFLPAVYQIRDVQLLEGPKAKNLTEVISYEGIYSDIAQIDDHIEIKGKLERVVDKTGQEHLRVLVGSPEGKGTEYIKQVN